MAGKLEGRVAIVTGAASGIGRATTLLFASEAGSALPSYAFPESAARALARASDHADGVSGRRGLEV
jgi:NAD(P)-dependent dehydrogenase (short-subunit alcohol dehydrogenase family)